MKRIFTLTAAALLIAACSPYQEQFRGLDERIASLKDEQAGTRQIVLSELDRLEKEILGKIDAMQEEVLDALDESVARAEDAILERTMTLRRSIRVMSARTGGDIEAWGERLGDMVDQSSSFFEKSLERMKAAQEDAIRRGDKVQQERISLVQNKVTWMQANLSGLSERAVNSVAALQGREDKYLEINALLPGLEKRKDDMQIILSQYEEQLREVIASRIKDMDGSDLGEFSRQLYDAYFEMEALNDELLGAYSDFEDSVSGMPDVESVLDDAQSLVDDMEDMREMVNSFDISYIEEVLSSLEGAYEYATSCEITTDGLEDRLEALDADVYDLWVEGDDYLRTLEDVWNILDDMLNDLESWIGDI